jgi:hypothetical protein
MARVFDSVHVIVLLISMTSSRFGWIGPGFVNAGSIQDVVHARPFLTNAKNVLFEPYLPKKIPRSFESKSNLPATAKQYLIRVQQKKKSQVYKELVKITEYVQYLAYDTFLAPLTESEMEAVMKLEGVHKVAFHLPSAMKMPNEMAAYIESDSSEDFAANDGIRTIVSKSVTILVVVVAQLSPEDLKYFCHDHDSAVCSVQEATPGKILAIETNNACKRAILVRCSAHPMVRWLEEKKPAKALNKFASGIIQGNGEAPEQRHPFWEQGLTGDGEIIGPPNRNPSPQCSSEFPSQRVAAPSFPNPR